MLAMLILGQALSDLPAIRFDLNSVPAGKHACASSNIDGILACAKRSEPEHDAAKGPEIMEALPRAEIGLFGKARARIGVQQGAIGGIPSNK